MEQNKPLINDNNHNASPNEFPIIFPERVERHNRSKPPKDAYLFFPKPEEMVDYDEKNQKGTRRRIFEGKGENYLLDFERIRLDQLYKEIEGESIVFPEEWKETETLRFLQSTSFDNQKAINLIKEQINWRKSFFPLKVNKSVQEILNAGFIYVHGRDNHFRPLVVLNAKNYLVLKEKNYNFEDITAAIIYFVEYMLKFMLIPGQVEQWNIIGDLSDVRVFYLPTELMKIFKMLQSSYRARLNVIYIVGMSPFLNAIWTLVKPLIDAQTHKKIKFLKRDNKDQIFEGTNRQQVEEKYGGKAKNVIPDRLAPETQDTFVGYFPPIMPSDNYLKDTDKREDLLISEEKYRHLFTQGKLAVVSPYLLEKLEKISQGNSRTSKYESESVYEDARSFIPIGQNNTQLDISVYENCKEINSCNAPIETEGDNLVIDHEFTSNVGKSDIQFITPNQSMKDLMKGESNGKKVVDQNDIYTSNYNTGLYEEQIEKVRANSIFTPKKRGPNDGNSNTPGDKTTPYGNNETNHSNRENENKDYHQFTLNGGDHHHEYDNKVLFEAGIRQNCCSTKGKCVIF